MLSFGYCYQNCVDPKAYNKAAATVKSTFESTRIPNLRLPKPISGILLSLHVGVMMKPILFFFSSAQSEDRKRSYTITFNLKRQNLSELYCQSVTFNFFLIKNKTA